VFKAHVSSLPLRPFGRSRVVTCFRISETQPLKFSDFLSQSLVRPFVEFVLAEAPAGFSFGACLSISAPVRHGERICTADQELPVVPRVVCRAIYHNNRSARLVDKPYPDVSFKSHTSGVVTATPCRPCLSIWRVRSPASHSRALAALWHLADEAAAARESLCPRGSASKILFRSGTKRSTPRGCIRPDEREQFLQISARIYIRPSGAAPRVCTVRGHP